MEKALNLLIFLLLLMSCNNSENNPSEIRNRDTTIESPTGPNGEKTLNFKFNVKVKMTKYNGGSTTSETFNPNIDYARAVSDGTKLVFSIGDDREENIIILEEAYNLHKLFVDIDPINKCKSSISSKLLVKSFYGKSKKDKGKEIINNRNDNSCKPMQNEFKCYYSNESACNRDLTFRLDEKNSIKLAIQNIRDVTISEIVLDDGAPIIGGVQ